MMASTSINYFLHMWRDNTLQADVTWRAYDFAKGAKPRHIKMALKQLHLTYAGELALTHFMALYEIPDRAEAERILAQWWLWRAVSIGARVSVPLRKPQEAGGATTLAGGSPEGPSASGKPAWP